MPGRPALVHTQQVRICFVCLGNICRSPTAEGIMAAKLESAGLASAVRIDSAGTGAWHRGEPPDERAVAEAARRGVILTSRARQVHAGDFEDFDLLLAMDRSNLRDLHRLAPDEEAAARVKLLREFDPAPSADLDVPDPYYGGPGGFEEVLDLVQAACAGLLARVREEAGL
jgi:protein-tyrosine phosphatase